MNLNEKLFSYLHNKQKEIFKPKAPNAQLALESIEERLVILSSMLFGEMTKVMRGNLMGGMVGTTLYCPPAINFSNDIKTCELAYIYHICFSYQASKLGHILKYDQTTPKQRVLLTIAAIPSILHKIREEFPSLDRSGPDLFSRYFDFLNENGKGSKTSHLCYFLTLKTREMIERHHNKAPPLGQQPIADDIFVTASKLAAEIKESRFKDRPNETLIPPFFALLPLDGAIHLYKNSSTLADHGPAQAPTTTIKTDPKDIIKKFDIDEDENYNPVTMLLETVKTADHFQGGKKRIDGADELNNHLEALEELDVRDVVRTKRETKSIFQASISYEVVDETSDQLTDYHPRSYLYPEWNFSKKRYLKRWCQIIEQRPCPRREQENSQAQLDSIKKNNARQIKELRHQIELITTSRRWKNRQLDGDEIDLDAVIDATTSIRSGHSPDERLYQSKRKSQNDVSILILLDSSLSSDSWVDGHRVLDIAKETIVILQEVLEGIFENISIMAFNSQTRQKCNYYTIRDFHENKESTADRLLNIVPDGYTRIGTALRHSIFKISKTKSHKKVIFLLTDGKPTDYDMYEGRYGINDVRQAIREAKQQEIEVFSLAIDQGAKYYLPQMFGRKNFRILKHPQYLPDCFISLFSKLL
jgi:uncharacterized protein YegL